MADAPIACASTRTASSRPSRLRPRPLCLPTPFGAASASPRPCTARTVNLCQHRSTPKHMANRRVRSRNSRQRRRRPTICLVPQAVLQVRTKLILLMAPLLLLTMIRAVIR